MRPKAALGRDRRGRAPRGAAVRIRTRSGGGRQKSDTQRTARRTFVSARRPLPAPAAHATARALLFASWTAAAGGGGGSGRRCGGSADGGGEDGRRSPPDRAALRRRAREARRLHGGVLRGQGLPGDGGRRGPGA